MIRRLPLLLGALLLAGAAEPPSQPTRLPPAEAAKEGRAFVAELLSQKPRQSVTNTGTLKIGKRPPVPIKFEIIARGTNWLGTYETTAGTNDVKLTVFHTDDQPNQYRVDEGGISKTLQGNETMTPFAGSDFWVADLGLEFLRWPAQNLVKKEMRRSCACNVLESINPQPAPGAYRRVVSWIDTESLGIVVAEAYDIRNKLLKEFVPKDIKKVNGQWQLEEMEIDNRQTGSRTRVEFNLDAK